MTKKINRQLFNDTKTANDLFDELKDIDRYHGWAFWIVFCILVLIAFTYAII